MASHLTAIELIDDLAQNSTIEFMLTSGGFVRSKKNFSVKTEYDTTCEMVLCPVCVKYFLKTGLINDDVWKVYKKIDLNEEDVMKFVRSADNSDMPYVQDLRQYMVEKLVK